MTFWGIVVAAGRGRRFGTPKHEVFLAGKPLWLWGRDVLERAGAEGVVVVGPVPDGVPGGPRRRDSVAAGLREVPEDVEVVLVHDAARPLASVDLTARVLARLAEGDADAAVPVVEVTDAVKSVHGDWVVEDVDRSLLVAAQTPQGFRAGALRRAHASIEGDVPDDAALIERGGGRVAIVPGERTNFKITHPEDLAMAEALVR